LGSITLEGTEGSGPLGELVANAGFFPSVFSQDPSPMLERAPAGDLGPRYVVTYVVPGPYGEQDTLRQDMYPYALPEPVSYMAPGQQVFGTERTDGGWYIATSQLKETLVAAGLPETAPTDTGGSSFPWALAALVALAVLGLAAALLLRRRIATPAMPAP
jgi:hypothetical protein